MSNFNLFIDGVKEGAVELAKELFEGLEKEAVEDAAAFLETLHADLLRWTDLLLESQLNKEDFNDLVRAKKALAQIHALRQQGVALAKVEKFRCALIDLVIDTAFDTFL